MRILQVQDHIQEVVTPEDSPLQQQETETDAVPDDPCFITRQLTLFTALLLRCRTEGIQKHKHVNGQTDRQASRQVVCLKLYCSLSFSLDGLMVMTEN